MSSQVSLILTETPACLPFTRFEKACASLDDRNGTLMPQLRSAIHGGGVHNLLLQRLLLRQHQHKLHERHQMCLILDRLQQLEQPSPLRLLHFGPPEPPLRREAIPCHSYNDPVLHLYELLLRTGASPSRNSSSSLKTIKTINANIKTANSDYNVATGLLPSRNENLPASAGMNQSTMIKKKTNVNVKTSPSDATSTNTTMGRPAVFPTRLHQALLDLEAQGEEGTRIAAFMPNGKAFIIYRPREFVQLILPKYFNTTRFASFQRQLNLYRFQRITEGPGQGAYCHKLFRKDNPNLAGMIRRDRIINTMV